MIVSEHSQTLTRPLYIFVLYVMLYENVGYLHPSFCDNFSHIYGAEETINYVNW